MKYIKKYRGIGIFGSAHQVMIENDSHAPKSVDRVLAENMIKLCSETVDYLYSDYTSLKVYYEKRSRPKLDHMVEDIISEIPSEERIVVEITKFVSRLVEKAEQDIDKVRIGGLEEEIIERGSDWCTDLSRVGCVLFQVAGLPSRMVTLIKTDAAYGGHVIIEVYRRKVWGAVDPTTNVVYRDSSDKPVTTWELMNNPQLVKGNWRDESTGYTNVEQFSAASIVNYFVWKWMDYDYTISGVNDYYRSILEMSEKGWPGGIRWLHGEDKI